MSVRWLTDVSQTKIEVTMKFNTKPTHTCGRRIRAAGVSLETHKLLLGHKNGDITSHCSADEIAELLEASNRICLTKSGNGFSEKKNRLAGYVKRLILLLNMVRPKRFELLTPWFVACTRKTCALYIKCLRVAYTINVPINAYGCLESHAKVTQQI